MNQNITILTVVLSILGAILLCWLYSVCWYKDLRRDIGLYRNERIRHSVESLPHFQTQAPRQKQKQKNMAKEIPRTTSEWEQNQNQNQATAEASGGNGQGKNNKKKNKGKGKQNQNEQKKNGDEWGHQDKPKEEEQQGGWKPVDGLDPNSQPTTSDGDTSGPSDSGTSEWNQSDQADHGSASGPSDSGTSSAFGEWDRSDTAHQNSPEPSVQQDTNDEMGNTNLAQSEWDSASDGQGTKNSPEPPAKKPPPKKETSDEWERPKFDKSGW